MRWDRPLDNFCMILAKLMVAKKFRHEYSVTFSTSSSCFFPLGSIVVFTSVCLAARGMFSSGRIGCGFLEKLTRQYRKKLCGNQDRRTAEKQQLRTCSLANRPWTRRTQRLLASRTSSILATGSWCQEDAVPDDGIS